MTFVVLKPYQILGEMTIGVNSHNAVQSYVLVFGVDGYQQTGESPFNDISKLIRLLNFLNRYNAKQFGNKFSSILTNRYLDFWA